MDEPERRLNGGTAHASLAARPLGTVAGMRVLVIEDDEAIRSVLERGLRADGFDVDTCADGGTGLWKALEGGYAAVVLDLLLPVKTGYQVCEALRAEGDATPVLVLTAKSGEFDQIDLLDAGADDFLTKPVSIAVVAARLRALIRRSSSIASNRIERGALVYDLADRRCTVGDDEVTFTSREDQLLRQLLLANGACVTRQELLDAVWGPAADVDSTNLDIYIRRLRTKLEPVEVENVRGLGYRITTR
jgi:DNA-binding response OmpR family regulator